MGRAGTAAPRGAPLLMLVLLLTAWTGARALWWENPFAHAAALIAPLASAPPDAALPWPQPAAPAATLTLAKAPRPAAGYGSQLGLIAIATGWAATAPVPAHRIDRIDPRFAAAHQLLWRGDLRTRAMRDAGLRVGGARGYGPETFAIPPRPPFLVPSRSAPTPAPAQAQAQALAAGGGRWSVDGWGLWRQGSGAAPASQGRVPIYGASQVGAVLQYRVVPDARPDPRLYARAYRALVRRGEQELALGASLRPLARVPVRIAGELRLTDAAFTNEVRPAAFAVTELAPIPLAYGAQFDVYGQAGWVGGASATAFADGQASVTRAITAVGGATDNAVRLSVGAGAWGGAQDDAQRIDLGPTLRLDLRVGDVPARLALDWRERVGGQAGPDSGLAATLSARF